MQTQKWITFLTMVALFSTTAVLTSCEKDKDNEPTEETMTNEEAAELLEASMKSGAEGLADEMLLAAELAESAVNKGVTTLDCGETRDSTIANTVENAWVTAAYTSTLTWGLICNNFQVPTDLTYSRNAEGNYETTRWISDDEAAGNWTISQLLTGATWIVNGSYERQGYQESKVREMRTFNSTILYQVNSLNISKADQRITSGTANFTISGQGSDGGSFNITGEIIFNGNGTATVTINGEEFIIDLF